MSRGAAAESKPAAARPLASERVVVRVEFTASATARDSLYPTALLVDANKGVHTSTAIKRAAGSQTHGGPFPVLMGPPTSHGRRRHVKPCRGALRRAILAYESPWTDHPLKF